MQPADHAKDAELRDDAAPMPPVSTQSVRAGSGSGDARMAPPFVGRPTLVDDRIEESRASAQESWSEQPATSWEDASDEGTVEPAFAADVSETEAALAALSEMQTRLDAEFPLDAFIIPEHTRHVPSGVEAKPDPGTPTHTPITDLAERLEKLSHRLRVEDTNTVLARLAAGDKMDAMLAGLLAGYLAGAK